MSKHNIDRRHALQLLGTSAGIALLPKTFASNPAPFKKAAVLYCLNTATIRQQKLGMVKELEIIAKAGYEGAEIWMDTLETYLGNGGTITELQHRINDLGITVENAIGFEQWVTDDELARKTGMEQLKRQMDLLAKIGCRRIAAPPTGITDRPGFDLKKAAERYLTILQLGDQMGVVPQLELWGFSANLNKLSEVMYVALETGHPKAKVLLDNYHLYKGGSNIASLHLIDHSATDIFHMNDFPGIPAAKITDADRVMPGDGVSPLKNILGILNGPSRRLVLSIEIFNQNYYRQDPLEVAQLALKKMKTVAEAE